VNSSVSSKKYTVSFELLNKGDLISSSNPDAFEIDEDIEVVAL
jgi:hypothetical protein